MSKSYPIKHLRQFEAVTSPARGEIIDIIDLMGPLSIAEIAASLGRPVDSLYYHVRKLLKVGLLVEVGLRKAKRREEALYDLPGRPMYLNYDPSNRRLVECVIKSITAMLRMAERNFKTAYEKNLVHAFGKKRNTTHSRVLGWYTFEEIVQLRAQIQETIDQFRNSAKTRKPSSELYALTTILIPLEQNPRLTNDKMDE